MSDSIYLDYSATTPTDPSVIAYMCDALTALPGNAGSVQYQAGWEAQQAIQVAAETVAETVSADAQGLIWTSGATEANNLAIFGVTERYARQGKHLITSAMEHPAVLRCFQHLARQGFEVTYLKPNAHGYIEPEQVAQALRSDTILVSIMHANNELGVIQPIAAIAKILQGRGVLLHVDAAQTLGKIPVNATELGADLLVLSAHKCYGPKGVGCLILRQQPRCHIAPQILGGGQQRGLRSGTLATHQIMGFAQACRLVAQQQDAEALRLRQYAQQLRAVLQSLPQVTLTCPAELCLPGHIHFSVQGCRAEVLLSAMPQLALSSGSACRTDQAQPSHVLTAMGWSPQRALSSLRLSLGRYTQAQDIEKIANILQHTLGHMLASASMEV